jgi:hypothetical protein
MRSPYDYIGVNKGGNKVVRTDLMLLDALSNCDAPVTTAALTERADPRGLAKLTSGDTIRLLSFMLADGFVTREGFSCDNRLTWKITEKGRAYLIAEEARDIFNTPLGRDRRCADKPRIEEAPEPIRRTEAGAALHEQLVDSHAHLDNQRASASVCNAKEPEVPPTALLCVDENELDDWWESLDVEGKADAFAQFALNMHHGFDSHIHVERTDRAPLAGTVGNLSPELTDKIKGQNAPPPFTAPPCGATADNTFHIHTYGSDPEALAREIRKAISTFADRSAAVQP